MPDHSSSIWLHDLEPLMDRRRANRRSGERRSGMVGLGVTDRRRGADRRLRERRETVGEHLRNALQVLLHCTAGRDVAADVRHDVSAAARRVWLALRELERGMPVVERLNS